MKVADFLKARGIEASYIKKLMDLQKPEVSRKLFCNECWDKLFNAARQGNKNPDSLKTMVCETCNAKYVEYMST